MQRSSPRLRPAAPAHRRRDAARHARGRRPVRSRRSDPGRCCRRPDAGGPRPHRARARRRPRQPARHLAEGVDPRLLVDKRLQVEHARAVGVPVPQRVGRAGHAAFPVVVKTAMGFGGGGVRIAADQAELEAAWAGAARPGAEPFLQEYLTRSVSTGGVALRRRAVDSVAYDGHPAPDDPTGPVAGRWSRSSTRTPSSRPRRSCAASATPASSASTGSPGPTDGSASSTSTRACSARGLRCRTSASTCSAPTSTCSARGASDATAGRYGVAARLLRYPCPPAQSREDVLTLARGDPRGRAHAPHVLGRRWAAVVRVRTVLGTARALTGAARRRRQQPPQRRRSPTTRARRRYERPAGQRDRPPRPVPPLRDRFLDLAVPEGIRAVACTGTRGAEPQHTQVPGARRA